MMPRCHGPVRWVFPACLLLGSLVNAQDLPGPILDTLPTPAADPAAQEEPEAEDSESNIGRWYQVELILFERTDGSGTEEDWPTFPDLSATGDAQELLRADGRLGNLNTAAPAEELRGNATVPPAWPLRDPDTGEERAFVLLPDPLLQLDEPAQKLDAGGDRRVLLHIGWNMSVQGEDDPHRIRLRAGEAGDGRARIDGTLAVHVGRYLHVAPELYATRYERTSTPLRLFFSDQPVPDVLPHGTGTTFGPWQPELKYRGVGEPDMDPQWVPTQSIRFRDSRRMRSNELHYLDHPGFGLVIRFTPYEPLHEQSDETPDEAPADGEGVDDAPAEENADDSTGQSR